MLSRIDKYIGLQILFSTFVVMLIVIGLMAMSLFLEEIEDVDDIYTLTKATLYVVYSLPGLIYQMLPFSVLVGTLVGLGSLASSSEITVLRASGVSELDISIYCIKPVLILSAVGLLLCQFGLPQSQIMANDIKNESKVQNNKSLLESSGWFKESDGFLRVGAIVASGKIYDVTRYSFDSGLRLTEKRVADMGTYNYETNTWDLENVSITSLENGALSFLSAQLEKWSGLPNPDLLLLMLTPPSDLSLKDLYRFSKYLSVQGVDPSKYSLVFWNKLLQPLSMITLVLVSVGFILGSLRDVSVGQRIIVGVLVGFLFRFTQELLAPASQVLGFSPLMAALTPILISFIIAFWLLARVR